MLSFVPTPDLDRHHLAGSLHVPQHEVVTACHVLELAAHRRVSRDVDRTRVVNSEFYFLDTPHAPTHPRSARAQSIQSSGRELVESERPYLLKLR